MKHLKTIQYQQEDSIAIISIDRPDAMNSINEALRSDLLFAFEKASQDKNIKIIVLNGNGRNFSAGADLKDKSDLDKTIEDVLNNEYRPIFEIIINSSKPVIASIHGSAAGIGLSIALTCDLVIMADDAFLLSPFTAISLVPDGGLNWTLVNHLGYKRAFQVSIEGQRLDADFCVKNGIVNKSVPIDKLKEETLSWAKSIAKKAPLSLKGTKKIMRFAESKSWDETYKLESRVQQSLQSSHDFKEGVDAFIEKREPVFKGE